MKDLRDLFAIKLAEAGANMHDIQQALGHASVATTERHYAYASPEHSSRKILRVLEGGKSEDFRGTNSELTAARQRPLFISKVG
jgi:integrase